MHHLPILSLKHISFVTGTCNSIVIGHMIYVYCSGYTGFSFQGKPGTDGKYERGLQLIRLRHCRQIQTAGRKS